MRLWIRLEQNFGGDFKFSHSPVYVSSKLNILSPVYRYLFNGVTPVFEHVVGCRV